MPTATASKNTRETWVTTTGGTVWVQLKDPRQPGGWRAQKVGGRGTQRLNITVDEREFNQELIPYENADLDPFQNGLLVRTHPKVAVKGENELTDEDLVAILTLPDDDEFMAKLVSIKSEVILRRLAGLGEKHTNVLRLGELRHYVDTKYPIGKTSRVVKEMYDDDAKYADADI